MAAPNDAPWADTNISDANLNTTTYGQGTSFPSTWATDRLFWRTDENIIYKNTGTEGTPVWTAIGIPTRSDFPTSNTIPVFYHDGLFRFQARTGTDPIRYQTTERTSAFQFWYDPFTSYANQTAFDAAYPTDDNTAIGGDATNDEIDFDAGTVARELSHDLGEALSGTTWAMRFQLDLDTVTSGNANERAFFIGMFDDATQTAGTAQDFIGLEINVNATDADYVAVGCNEAAPSSPSTSVVFTSVSPAVHTKYIEIKRTSSTEAKVGIYSDSGFTTLDEEETLTVSSSYDGLQYFGIKYQQASSTNDIVGSLKNLLIQNDDSSV